MNSYRICILVVRASDDSSADEFNFEVRIAARCSFSYLITSTSFDEKVSLLKVLHHLKATKIDQVSICYIVSVDFLEIGNARNQVMTLLSFHVAKGLSRVYGLRAPKLNSHYFLNLIL